MRFLLAPRWLIAHVVVLALGVTFVLLGAWQMDRLSQRRLDNEVMSARLAAEVAPLEELLAAVGDDLASLEYRRVRVQGSFVPAEEVLWRSQVRESRAGFDVVTPLVLADGSTVLVDRGWVPLEFDTVPVTAAIPAEGRSSVEGVVRLTQERSGVGRDDFAEGPATSVSRIDIAGLDPQVTGDLMPVWIQVTGSAPATVLPVPASLPDFTDEGPHRDYAIQWFSFALIAAVGYGLLIRRAIRLRSRGGEAIDDLHAG